MVGIYQHNLILEHNVILFGFKSDDPECVIEFLNNFYKPFNQQLTTIFGIDIKNWDKCI